jgi:hypothetical protein
MTTLINCFTYIARGNNGEVIKKGYFNCQTLDTARSQFNKRVAPYLKGHISTEFLETECQQCESKNDVTDFWHNEKEHVLCVDCRFNFLQSRLLNKNIYFDSEFVKSFLETKRTWGDIPESVLKLFKKDVEAKLHAMGYQGNDRSLYSKVREGQAFDLNEKLLRLFIPIHNKHLRQWESESRIEQHSFTNIEKLYWHEEDECFRCYYKETDDFKEEWYQYYPEGTWA